MLGELPFTTNLYQRGANGVPSTSLRLPVPAFDSLEWSIAAVGGFESLRLPFTADVEEALWWQLEALGGSINISDADAQTCWDGQIVGVDVTIGQEQRSLSLDPMANAVKVRFTTATGVGGAYPTLSTFSSNTTSTTSQGLYGIKQAVISSDAKTLADAGYAAARFLNERAYPRATPNTAIGTGALGAPQVTLICAGWYYTMDWLTLNNTSTSTVATETQIGSLITGYNAVNNFFNTATGGIVTTGRSPSQYIDLDTTYRSRFETLLGLGNSSDQRLIGGVYEDRAFTVKTWAGASPTTIGYRRSITGMDLVDGNNCPVDLWQARPDVMYETKEFLGFDSTDVDTGGRYYVERINFRADASGYTLTLEPQNANGIDVILARFSAGIR